MPMNKDRSPFTFCRWVLVGESVQELNKACDDVDAIMCKESGGEGKHRRRNIIYYGLKGCPDYESGFDLGFITDAGLSKLKSKYRLIDYGRGY